MSWCSIKGIGAGVYNFFRINFWYVFRIVFQFLLDKDPDYKFLSRFAGFYYQCANAFNLFLSGPKNKL